MRLEIEVLDGPQKGQKIQLKNGLQIGKKSPLAFADAQMAEIHGIVSFDYKNSWNIECLAPLILRLGSEEVSRAQLLPGLVFHLGQTAFKIVEKKKLAYDSWQEGLKDWLKNNPGQAVATDLFFFENPLRLTFVQGAQFEEYYTLGYGPRELGFNNLDINLIDFTAPSRVVSFFKVGEQPYIENLCGDKAKINGEVFDQHRIETGDRLSVASNVIELSILK